MFGKFQRDSRRAFTLSEFMIGVAVSSVILVALLSFTVYSSRSFAAMSNYIDLEQKSQDALDQLTRDIRQTLYMTNFTTREHNGVNITNAVSFLDSDGQILTFRFTNDVLLRTKAGVNTTLLTNVDFLTFGVFQRNPLAGQYDQFGTTNAVNCKLVSVSWICSRSILGSKMNTESVQTAKIVIRKQ